MKTYVELGLAALLAVLVYEKPAFLVNMANSTLGIVVMIVTVAVLAKQFGINAGLLAAIIMILLQESYRENFEHWVYRNRSLRPCTLHQTLLLTLKPNKKIQDYRRWIGLLKSIWFLTGLVSRSSLETMASWKRNFRIVHLTFC